MQCPPDNAPKNHHRTDQKSRFQKIQRVIAGEPGDFLRKNSIFFEKNYSLSYFIFTNSIYIKVKTY